MLYEAPDVVELDLCTERILEEGSTEQEEQGDNLIGVEELLGALLT